MGSLFGKIVPVEIASCTVMVGKRALFLAIALLRQHTMKIRFRK